jgi:hypothetical protein
VGFIHHSNIGAYGPLTKLARRAPGGAVGPLVKRGLMINIVAWRAESMTADLFALLLGGPAAVESLMDVVGRSRRATVRPRAGSSSKKLCVTPKQNSTRSPAASFSR